jgi:hypothetical protein
MFLIELRTLLLLLFEKMEGFSFVMPVTGLDRCNTGKEDDEFSSISRLLSKSSFGWRRRHYISLCMYVSNKTHS